MVILINPRDREQERLMPSEELPRWFAAPILAADPSTSVCRAPRDIWKHVSLRGATESVLVFTVGRLEASLSLLPHNSLRICSLFQWLPLEKQPLIKRHLYHHLLLKSRILLTYSRESETYLRTLFPAKTITWIGMFTDTDFFKPEATKNNVEPYFICVGDHKRYEHVLDTLAMTLKTPIVRVTTDPNVARYHSLRPCPLVKLFFRTSFLQLRRLYDEAELVLNPVDDRWWPVGITSFCEALSMNKMTVTSGGHSCSGYEFADGHKPYVTVVDAENSDCWLDAISQARSINPPWPRGRSPRDLALKLCSFESTVAGWRRALELLESS